MGSNSNRTRQPCKHAGCLNLSRAMSGLCVTHRLLPVEAVKMREERPLSADCGRWKHLRGPLTWRDGVVARELPAEATQAPDPVHRVIDALNGPHSANARDLCGISHCDTHADGSEVQPQGYTLGEMMIFAVAIVGLVALAAWTLHNHGLI